MRAGEARGESVRLPAPALSGRAMRHFHPGEEVIYVLEGTIKYEVDGEPAQMVQTGEVLTVPAERVHSAKNIGTGPAAELATYIVEKGKPLVTVAD